ncbi:hemagglutinin repeat-containing protein [Fusobacterium nucleatum]|uniref:hemagglutinin repeat-containing protein n=1 Tax=Fusobacterium nucleatum TaxID=851 RepID=UPI003CC804A0
MKSGDILVGIASTTNTVTGVVSGLASNQGTKLPLSAVNKNNSDDDNDDNQDNTVGKDNLKAAQATNNFYANVGVNLGFNKSSSKTNSHNERAVVTTTKGKDKDSSITYNDVKNIEYVGTQAQNTKFIYNNVDNIDKRAVELNNSYSSDSKSSGVSTGVTIGYGDGVQTEANGVSISASKSKMNTNGTNFQNGRFINVDEVHNNTKNMTLSGFNQESGTVTGNIENLTIESKQNTSTTKGSTKGGSLSISANGLPSGSANYSKTNGERKYVDNASTFIIGNESNLKVGKVENTAAAIGASGNGKLSIDEYLGHNLENVDKLKTAGGSVGISTSGINSIGINYSDRKQEGIIKNTVIGNVEIGKSSGAEINKDLDTMTEITKDRKFETNVNIESQTIKYALNPEAFKQDLAKAKDEITDIGSVVENSINPKGKDKRNIFANLRAQRWNTSFYNVTGSRMEELSRQFKAGEIDEKELKEAARDLIKGYGKDIGIDFEVLYLDEATMPKDSKGSTGSSYILDKKNRKVLIPIDVNKLKDTGDLFGTLTEEVSHGKDALEGRQDLNVANDETNKEKGLESLGRPANEYVKNKLGEDNNSKISLTTDGIDLSNANVGEKVGDNSFALETVATTGTGMVTGISAPVVAGIAVAGGIVYYNIFMPEEEKEQLKREIFQIYENTKEGFSSILDKEDFKDLVIAVIKSELKERGIEADVKIDKDGNVIYTLSPLPEDMKKPKIPSFPLPDKKIFQIPPMIPPKQETQKERWEREERAKREEQEFFNELQKLNGIPLHQERPVTIIYTKSDGKKFDGKYKPSPKHDPKTGYPGASKSNIPDIETGQELLEDSYGNSKVKQRYVWYRGRLVEFQPGNDGTWHDYTVDGNEVPIDVLRQMRDDGIITNSEYQKLKKGKK